MRKTRLIAVAGLSAVALLALSIPALAKSKHAKSPSYQEAWATCKKFTDEGVWSWDQHGQRLQRGGSCMLRHGFRFGDYPD
jgi:hypothetical protein